MRVLCAPDSFKDSLTSAEAAGAMRLGLLDADPTIEVDLCPMSDGGEGFRETLAANLGGTTTRHDVTGPLGSTVTAGLTVLPVGHGAPSIAVIEMAEAAGLVLVPPADRDPAETTTRGVGQMVKIALDAGAERILMGIGGSATNDGGAGLAQALGYRFLDAAGRALATPITGGMLVRVARIDATNADGRLPRCEVRVACDVTNPLLGPNGAAPVYAPQKGATPEQIPMLEDGLARLAERWRLDLGVDVADRPGAGAAGGLGGGAVAFLGATLEPGVEIVLDATRLDERVRRADLCLTGEGRIDDQTLAGKVILGVTRTARRHGVPVVALVGRIAGDRERIQASGLRAICEIAPDLSTEESMRQAGSRLRTAARQVMETPRAPRCLDRGPSRG